MDEKLNPIPDKRNNVNQMSKKFKLPGIFGVLMFRKKPSASGRKTIHHEPVHVG